MQSDELVTVVIPARNEEGFLGTCLDSVRGQDHDALQIIVVVGDSTDGTGEVVKAHMAEDDRVELIHNPQPNIPSSLNLALADARGQWLVRVDAHSTIGPTYVRTALSHLREGGWGGVGGRKDGVGHTSAGRAIAVALGSRFGVGNSTYHFGTTPQEVDHLPFGAYPVEVIRRMGGWDERLEANEDFEFDYRLKETGLRLLFDPSMVISWHSRQSIGELYRQYRRYGRGKVDVALMHPASMRVRHFVPPVLIAYLVVGGLLSLRRPGPAIVLIAPYPLALAAESLRSGRELQSTSDRLWLAPAFAAMHLGWGIGFWSGVRTALKERSRSRRI